MGENAAIGRISKLVRFSSREGFKQAYARVRVDPEKYLRRVRRAHRLPIESWEEMLLLGPEVANPIATGTIASAAKMAGIEGMGLGIGGLLTIVPDMSALSAITIRLLQKLSLLYGFEYATEEEMAELWIAAASAAGVDVARDFVEKQAAERVLPRLADAIAVKAGSDMAEKWAARLAPVLSAGAGAAINYFFVRSWGRRAQRHFLARHTAWIARETAATFPGRLGTLPGAAT